MTGSKHHVKGAVAAAMIVVCVVANRGGGCAAMLRGCVANVLGGSKGQEGTWTIHWQRSAGLWLNLKARAIQFQCWHQLDGE